MSDAMSDAVPSSADGPLQSPLKQSSGVFSDAHSSVNVRTQSSGSMRVGASPPVTPLDPQASMKKALEAKMAELQRKLGLIQAEIPPAGTGDAMLDGTST